MPLRIRLLVFICSVCTVIFAQHAENPHVVTPHVSPALRFTENIGQWENTILFKSTFGGGALFIERQALTFSFYDQKKYSLIHMAGINKGLVKDPNIQHHAYKIHFEGANPSPKVEKQQEGTDYENFYIGSDQSKWKSNVRNYHQVYLREMYAGIDYEIITAARGMKYNFHVKQGADVRQIKMRYEGVDHMFLKNGALILKLSINGVTEQRPYAYQSINGEIVPVPCNYVLKNNNLSFELPKGYNKNYDLVIDPILVFAASSGSNADNFGMTATFDSQGNLYSGGTAFSNGYPVSFGAFSFNYNGNPASGITDVVITKYNSTGNSLLYSTYIGGTQAEIVSSLIVDHSNNLCFYGATGSSNFPMLSNSFDPSFNGGVPLSFVFNGTSFTFGTDIYVAKFNSSGTALLGSTFLGGSGNDGVNHVNHLSQVPVGQFFVNEFATDSLQFNYGDQYRGEIQVDVANNIYIASSTRSNNFPTVNALDGTLGGKQDAVICKLNTSLSQLLYSTYLGGSSNECGNSLIVNNSLEVFVTGGTCSPDFPATIGAFDQTYNGGIADAYLAHINTSGNALMEATFLGTNSYDQSYFVQTDKYANVYVYGQSLGNMPILAASNATAVFSNPGRHQFITRFNRNLSQINMATVIGSKLNTVDISPCAFAVDKCNNIYLSGWGGNIINSTNPLSNMPLFQPTQTTTNGFDFYFMGLDSNAQALKYGSYFGGLLSSEHVDGGTSRFDPGGRIYQSACAGCGGNDDWPVTPGAWPLSPGNQNHSGNCNNGVVKLDFQLQTAIATIQTSTMAGCVPFVASFTSATPPTGSGATFIWYLAPGVTTSTNPNPTITYTAPGIYTVALVIKDNLTCNRKDSAVTFITIFPKPTAIINFTSTGCTSVVNVVASSVGNFVSASPHFWNFGTGTSTLGALSFTYPSAGNYNLSYTVTDVNGCKDVATNTVNVFSFLPTAVASASMCSNKSATLTASGGTSYTWSPSANLSSTSVAAPVASPPTTTTYSVIIFNNTGGTNCIDTLVTQVIVQPVPIANYSLDTSPCSNKIITSNFSSGNLSSNPFTWNFGDGSPLVNSPSPIHTYSGNGTYTVTMLILDLNGCETIATQTVAIFNFTPGVVSSSSLCFGNTTTLVAQGGTTYSWTPGSSLTNSLGGTTAANPTVTTIYTVQIENNTPGYTCSKTLTTQILVRPTPTANFNFSINPCGGGVNFLDQSADDIATWNWTLTPTRTSTLQYPYNFYSAGGHYTITLVTANSFGCKNTMAKEIDVPKPPPLTVKSDTNICLGDKVQLDADGGIAYDWTPPSTLDFPNVHNPIATPIVTTEYSVMITTSQIVNGNACKFLLTTLVEVDVLSTIPISAFANPVVVTVGEPSKLTYVGQAGATVNWLPTGSTQPTFGYTVLAYPQRPTTYTAVAQRGACREDVEVVVDAYTAGCATKDFFVPNTFTPNGDGNNDVLYVRSLKTDELYFAVYNRWGELVFETSDPTKGWDGTYKGREADVGVFGWYYKAKCINGGETFQKGNVTLIR